jgi:WD40 repeat protein
LTTFFYQLQTQHNNNGKQGNMIASTDADGVVKLWDVRKVAEYATINVGPHSANRCSFDRSGLVMAIASNDSRVKWYYFLCVPVPVI